MAAATRNSGVGCTVSSSWDSLMSSDRLLVSGHRDTPNKTTSSRWMLLALIMAASVMMAILPVAPVIILTAEAGEPMATTSFGHFYVFADGQILVVDPSAGVVVTTLTSFPDSAIPMPNNCSNSPFRGSWVDVSVGAGRRTLYAAMRYATDDFKSTPFMSHGVAIVDVPQRQLQTRVPLSAAPHSLSYVPVADKVWVRIRSRSLFTTLEASGGKQLAATGGRSFVKDESDGSLLSDFNLGSKGYVMSSTTSGVFAIDIYNSTTTALFIDFVNATRNGTKCPGTLRAAYSRRNRQAFFSCSSAPGETKAGLVQLDTATDTVVKMWPIAESSSRLYMTPDESLLLVINAQSDEMHILQMNAIGRNVSQWSTLPFPVGSTPVNIIFVPKAPRYVGYIAFANSDRLGVLDFNQLLQCGPTCSSSNVGSFVQYVQQMGLQNPPTAPSWIAKSRALRGGNGWVCQAAMYDSALFCLNGVSGMVWNLRNVTGVQQIEFVPRYSVEPYSVLGSTVSPLDCSSIASSIPAPPPPPSPPSPPPKSSAKWKPSALYPLMLLVIPFLGLFM